MKTRTHTQWKGEQLAAQVQAARKRIWDLGSTVREAERRLNPWPEIRRIMARIPAGSWR